MRSTVVTAAPEDVREVRGPLSGKRRIRGIILTCLLTVATIVLFLVSRGKWSDAIIDSGREWIVPDALARGEVLYRDVVYWFGPFTPYFHAGFFKALGSSFQTLVVAGIVGSLGVLAALYSALRTVTGRLEAALWTTLAVPALVFMPDSGGSILGMGYRMWHAAAFALLAVAILDYRDTAPRPWRLLASGALAGLAGLCRTEWGILTLLAAGLVYLLQRTARRTVWRGALTILAGFLLVFAGVITLFGAIGGWDSLLRESPVLLMNVPEQTRSHVAFAGIQAWRAGIWSLLYSAALWVGLFLVTEIVTLRPVDPGRARRRLPWLVVLLGLFALSVWGAAGFPEAPIWSAAPLICLAASLVAVRGRLSQRQATLAGFGVLGFLLSHRRPFFIGDGPYVGPPLLFALACAAGLVQIVVNREASEGIRESLRAGILSVVVLLIGLAFAARLAEYRRDERVWIAGTGKSLSARAELALEIKALVAAIRASSRQEDGLVALPEGEIVNFLSGRANPLRHKLYLPGYVNDSNENTILRELRRAKPTAVVIWNRPTGEYGPGLLGEGYAFAIRQWIEDNYDPKPYSTARPRAALWIIRQTR